MPVRTVPRTPAGLLTIVGAMVLVAAAMLSFSAAPSDGSRLPWRQAAIGDGGRTPAGSAAGPQFGAHLRAPVAPALNPLPVDRPRHDASEDGRGPRLPATSSSRWSKPVDLGMPVNTLGWEDSVSISPDGNTLYFSYADFDFLTFVASGAKKKVVTGPPRGLNPGDLAAIMVATRQGDGWGAPRVLKNLSVPRALNDGAFSQDGRLLVHSGLRNANVGSAAASDIYTSVFGGGDWAEPVNLGPPINTRFSESNPWISPDRVLLLFDSDRPGGKGGRDLWQSRKVNGRWEEPVNLGGPVNTAGEEVQPFLTQDGRTLYFAGASRDGKGDHVIYCSHRTEGGDWGEPVVAIANMVGEPTLTADGQRLYFVHIRKMDNGTYNSDIMYTQKSPATQPIAAGGQT